MMNKRNILKGVVYISVGNMPYNHIKMDGNACFIGSNNLGKTTLLRSIVFFYNANPQRLGISKAKKRFDEYYFGNINSYLIYEVENDLGPYHIWVYKQNRIHFRFIEGPYRKELYIEDNRVLQLEEVLYRLNQEKINYSNQIDSFERYRNILYGAERDNQLKRFALLKGNEQYKNIPKSITDVFLSSDAEIKADFIKNFLADAITEATQKVDVAGYARQLRQFKDDYEDIRTFEREDNRQRSDMIVQGFDALRTLQEEQQETAIQLGNTLRWAEKRSEELNKQLSRLVTELHELDENFQGDKEAFEQERDELNKRIGAMESEVLRAKKKLQEYESKGMDEKLALYERKAEFIRELEERKNEYELLSSSFQDLESAYKARFSQLQDEEKRYLVEIKERGLQLDKEQQEKRQALTEAHNEKVNRLNVQHQADTEQVREEISSFKSTIQQLQSEKRFIVNKRYFEEELESGKKELYQLEKQATDAAHQIKLQEQQMAGIRKESEQLLKKLEEDAERLTLKTQEKMKVYQEEADALKRRLSLGDTAFYNFLETNYPQWQETIGKVCHEDLLFHENLTPKLASELQQALYGIEIDLSAIDLRAKTLADYEEQLHLVQKKAEEVKEERERQLEAIQKEKAAKSSAFSKQIHQLQEQIQRLTYERDQKNDQQAKLQQRLNDLKGKAEDQRKMDLQELASQLEEQERLLASKEAVHQSMKAQHQNKLQELNTEKEAQLREIRKLHDEKAQKLQEEKQNKLKDLESKRASLRAEKEKELQGSGIDTEKISQIEQQIQHFKQQLKKIDGLTDGVIGYLKDKKELFDTLPQRKQELETLQGLMEELRSSFASKEEKQLANKKLLTDKKTDFEKQVIALRVQLDQFESFKNTNHLYLKLKRFLEKESEQLIEEANIAELIGIINNFESQYHKKFDEFSRLTREFAGKFRASNHFNFHLKENPEEVDFKRFAQQLKQFMAENRIEQSKMEVAQLHTMLLNRIADEIKNLTKSKGQVDRMIEGMEKDFRETQFSVSKLIESIELRSQDTDNRIVKRLRKIQHFSEENRFLLGGVTLFNQNDKQKAQIDKKSVELLDDLLRVIEEEKQEEIRIQDLFELEFRIKEGQNDTGWVRRIEDVGSTGTDVLVKAMIYLTLISVFIKNSVTKASDEFALHCVIDEVGQISAPYLKALMDFANARNIYLVNGLPNESKLETHYNYTYMLRKREEKYVSVAPLLTTKIEI